MAQIGVLTTEFPATTFDEVVRQIAGHGIETVQLQLGSVFSDVATSDALTRGLDVLGGRLSADVAARAHETLVAAGITVAAVDGTYNMIDTDPDRRARNLDHLQALIELAGRFGTDVVTLCTGTRAPMMWRHSDENRSAEAWSDLLVSVGSACPVAERAGVTLAFEPEHNNVVDSAVAARRLLDEVASPALKVVMDAANLFHRGDLGRMHDHLDEAFELVGTDVVLAHAKDLDHDGDAGGRAVGRGLLDYGRYLALLQAYGFDGAIVLHQLSELAPAEIGDAFDYVRAHAPAGYLVG